MGGALAVAIGSVAGGLARYGLGLFVQRSLGTALTFYGTLAVNLTGCFLIGFFAAMAGDKLGPSGRLLLMTGFCGSFTTFSALVLESSEMLTQGDWIRPVLNVTLSLILGFLLFRLGVMAGDLI
jgi:CrcB protein